MFVPTSQVMAMNEKLKCHEILDINAMQIASLTLEEIVDLFAKGYTMAPPEPTVSLGDIGVVEEEVS